MYSGEAIYPSNSADPDNIPYRIIKLCAAEVSPFLHLSLLNLLMKGLYLVIGLTEAKITPIKVIAVFLPIIITGPYH